jgi:hypothetical protein
MPQKDSRKLLALSVYRVRGRAQQQRSLSHVGRKGSIRRKFDPPLDVNGLFRHGQHTLLSWIRHTTHAGEPIAVQRGITVMASMLVRVARPLGKRSTERGEGTTGKGGERAMRGASIGVAVVSRLTGKKRIGGRESPEISHCTYTVRYMRLLRIPASTLISQSY